MELVDGETWRAGATAQPRGWREIVAAYLAGRRAGWPPRTAPGWCTATSSPNALIDRDGVVRVTDFGLVARPATPSASARPTSARRRAEPARLDAAPLTRTGAVMGTPAYMAPEQHAGEPRRRAHRSVGAACSLYEALYGQRPFAGATPRRAARPRCQAGAIRPEPPTRGAAPRSAPRSGARSRCDPADRFATMDELIAALSPPRRAWQSPPSVAAAVVAVAIAAAVVAGRGDDAATCAGLDAPIDAVWNQAPLERAARPLRRDRRFRRRQRIGSRGRRARSLQRAAGSRRAGARAPRRRQGVGSPRPARSPDALPRSAPGRGGRRDRRAGRRRCRRGAQRRRRGRPAASGRRLRRSARARCRGRPTAKRARRDRARPRRSWPAPRPSMPSASAIARCRWPRRRPAWPSASRGRRSWPARSCCAACASTARINYDQSVATLDRAATAAAQAQDDALIAEALATRFYVLGERLGRPADAMAGRSLHRAGARAGRSAEAASRAVAAHPGGGAARPGQDRRGAGGAEAGDRDLAAAGARRPHGSDRFAADPGQHPQRAQRVGRVGKAARRGDGVGGRGQRSRSSARRRRPHQRRPLAGAAGRRAGCGGELGAGARHPAAQQDRRLDRRLQCRSGADLAGPLERRSPRAVGSAGVGRVGGARGRRARSRGAPPPSATRSPRSAGSTRPRRCWRERCRQRARPATW